MNTSLRILIDEAIEDDLAEAIASIPAFHAEYVRNIAGLRGSSDKAIMEFARRDNRIVLTFDSDYNSSNFPICTHPGIIRIAGRSKHHTMVADMLKRFSLCGRRSEVKHAIAHLTQEHCTIESANEKLTQHRY